MKMKSRMMAMLSIMAVVFIAATAQATFVTLVPDALNAAPGSTVTVSVNMSDSPGFTMTAISAVILYDPNVFTYVDPSMVAGVVMPGWDLFAAAGTPGELRVGSFSGGAVPAGNGTLFTFTLLANSGAPLGLSALSWGYADGGSGVDGFDYGDADWNDVVLPSYGASINVSAVSAVPEPTTMIAGALLLLPFGASTLRVLRKRQTA
jgi:hypothetical protein